MPISIRFVSRLSLRRMAQGCPCHGGPEPQLATGCPHGAEPRDRAKVLGGPWSRGRSQQGGEGAERAFWGLRMFESGVTPAQNSTD